MATAMEDMIQQIMCRKRQVTFATTEIDHSERPVFRKLLGNVENELQKAIDLPELFRVAGIYFAVGGHHARLDQKRTDHAILNQMIACAIVTGYLGSRTWSSCFQLRLPQQALPFFGVLCLNRMGGRGEMNVAKGNGC